MIFCSELKYGKTIRLLEYPATNYASTRNESTFSVKFKALVKMSFFVLRHANGVTGSFNHMRQICNFSELEKSYFTGKSGKTTDPGDFQIFVWRKEPVIVVVFA